MKTNVTWSCWQLAEFNLRGWIVLIEELGLVRICRSDDGTLMLVATEEYATPAPGNPVPVNFASLDSILGFVLDIGIARTKELSRCSGYYWGRSLRSVQSPREISQQDFDKGTFAWMVEVVNANFQSSDKKKVTEAIRCQHLIDAYNDSRLMYPNFHSEAYLSMLRIIEAVCGSSRRHEFAIAAAQLSADLNRKIVNSIDAVAAYRTRADLARGEFVALLADSNLK